MATSYSIPQILTISKVAEYLAANGSAKDLKFKSVFTDIELAKVIYMERKAVQLRYTLNPADTSLPLTSNYLFDLLGKYSAQAEAILLSQTQSAPTITNPSNQSSTVGGSATFSVTVTSSIAYSVQWYRNGVLIPGANTSSYTVTNTQLSDDGASFYATATNAVGTVTSLPATLSVTAALVAYAYYSSIDPYPTLSVGFDNLTYQITQTITSGSPITITWPLAAANNQYEVLKVPVGQPIKITWFNTGLNSGSIPDAVWRDHLTFGGFDYYISRNAMSLDSTVLTETFS